jgi:simple sugar transport system permease protein
MSATVSRLAARAARFARIAAPPAAAIAAGPLLVALFSGNPGTAIAAFAVGPVSSVGAAAAFIEQSALLALCALGAALAFRAGSFNLGGEGQLYAGGLAAVAAALALPVATPGVALAASLAAGAAGGALVVLPSALGKRFAAADVLLSSFLVSQAAVLAIDWLIASPLRDPASNLMATRMVARAILPDRAIFPAGYAPFAALLSAILLALFFARTGEGRAVDLYGGNPGFAKSVGLPVGALALWPLVFAGALHGLAGAFIALGPAGRAVRGMSGGMGWTAIAVSLLAANRPLVVIPAALLLGWLDSGARQAAVLAGVPFDAALLVKAFVLLLATARALPRVSRRRAPQ